MADSVVQYDNIYHNLGPSVGKLRFTQGGLGWKPTGGEGSTHTLEADRFAKFQWIKCVGGRAWNAHTEHTLTNPTALLFFPTFFAFPQGRTRIPAPHRPQQ